MISQAYGMHSTDSKSAEPVMLDEQEWIFELLPSREGIRFMRGCLWGISFCLPVWIWLLWAVAHHR